MAAPGKRAISSTGRNGIGGTAAIYAGLLFERPCVMLHMAYMKLWISRLVYRKILTLDLFTD